jgi:uncharacterized membrane protein YfcA
VLIALAAGALLGVALGTVGGGGAVLAVPVLVFLLGQSVHEATTASLVIVLAAATAGAASHARHGTSCWGIAAAFVAAAVPGSIAGTLLNDVVPGHALLGGFALLLLGVAWLTWRRAAFSTSEIEGPCPSVDLRFVAGAGLLTGALTGLFGVGGGFAVVPALALGLHVPLRRAIATSLVVVTAISSITLAEHLVKSTAIDWSVVLPFAAAAVLTASFGGSIARRLPRRTLARGFALMLAGIASYLIVSVTLLGGPPQG